MAEGGLVLTFELLSPTRLDACAEIASHAPDPWSRAVLERVMTAGNHFTLVATEGPHGARAPERSDAAGGCVSTSGGFDAGRQNTANPPRGEGPHGARAPERSDAAGGQAVGFASFLVVADAADLEMLAVSPRARRRGVATALLRQALPQLATQGVARALLEARQSNLAAIRLYEKLGFKKLALRPGMYAHPKEDGVLMGKTLSD